METYQRDLTTKQKLFCDFVLQGLNATRAALRAGYSRTTAENGCLMNMPKIKKYLAEHATGGEDVQVSHDMILKQLCKIAFANVQDCFMPDGMLKGMDDIGPDTMAAVESISITAAGDVKIKMYSKMAALEKIARRTGFYIPVAAKPVSVAEPVLEVAVAMTDQNDDFDQPLFYKDADGYMAGEISDNDAEEDTLKAVIFSGSDKRVSLKGDNNLASCVKDGGVIVPFSTATLKKGNPFYQAGWDTKSYNCCE